jgi:hypothetical protein
MTVTVALDVQYPANSPTLPLMGIAVSQNNPFVDAGYLRPWFAGGSHFPASGNTSGGSVKFTWSMRPRGNEQLYAAVTQLSIRTSEATAASYVTWNQDGDDWEKEPYRKGLIDIAQTYIPLDLITPDVPYALGQAKSGTSGDLVLTHAVNTNGKSYTMDVRGWVSDRPFLTPLNVAP